MTKLEREILIRVYTKQMEEASRQHVQITRMMSTQDLDEVTLTRRRACVKTVKRMQALIEQLQDDKLYRRIKTGSSKKSGKVSDPSEGEVLDRTLLIDPKEKSLNGIPMTIPE